MWSEYDPTAKTIIVTFKYLSIPIICSKYIAMTVNAQTDFDAKGDSVLRPSKLAHVVFRTSNFPAMVKYWKTFLGGHAQFESSGLSFITYDDEHHRVAIAEIPHLGDKHKKNNGFEVLWFLLHSNSPIFHYARIFPWNADFEHSMLLLPSIRSMGLCWPIDSVRLMGSNLPGL